MWDAYKNLYGEKEKLFSPVLKNIFGNIINKIHPYSKNHDYAKRRKYGAVRDIRIRPILAIRYFRNYFRCFYPLEHKKLTSELKLQRAIVIAKSICFKALWK